jgi:hypothetical protein
VGDGGKHGWAGQNITIDGTDVAYSNGTFAILKASATLAQFGIVVGSQLYLTGPSDYFTGDLGMGYVMRIYEDSTTVYFETTLGYPTLPAWAGGKVWVVRMGRLSVINCTGCDNIRLASQATEKGLQPWEYYRWVHAGKGTNGGHWLDRVGDLTRARISVVKTSATGTFELQMAAYQKSTLTDLLTYDIRVDMTVAGVRDFTQLALTGKQTNDYVKLNAVDQLTLPINRWVRSNFSFFMSYNPSTGTTAEAPLVEVELWFDCGMFRKLLPARVSEAGTDIIGITGQLP